jgi:hypothetical protein
MGKFFVSNLLPMRAAVFLVLVPFLAYGQTPIGPNSETQNEKLLLSWPGEVQLDSKASLGKASFHGFVGSLTVGIFGAFVGTRLDTARRSRKSGIWNYELVHE